MLLGSRCNVHVPAQILEYHVVPGMSMSASNLTDGQVLQTLLPGQSITVRCSCNFLMAHAL